MLGIPASANVYKEFNAYFRSRYNDRTEQLERSDTQY
jgi:hypothetical protein